MASVTFETLWIHDGSDLSDYIEADYYKPVRELYDKQGEVRRYAGGRMRSLDREGNMRKINIEFDWLSRTELDKLISWIGSTVMFRDNKGRLAFGTYQFIDVLDQRVYDEARVSITVTEVTHSLEV